MHFDQPTRTTHTQRAARSARSKRERLEKRECTDGRVEAERAYKVEQPLLVCVEDEWVRAVSSGWWQASESAAGLCTWVKSFASRRCTDCTRVGGTHAVSESPLFLLRAFSASPR